MNQFLLTQGNSAQLNQFAHIIEFAIKRNNATQLNFLNEGSTNSLRIYYALEGKFEWTVKKRENNFNKPKR
jgi:hypothetical protein